MKFLELLEEQLLIQEKLGNLASLKLGKMINALKQNAYTNRKSGTHISPNDKKFSGYNPSITDTSEIIDIGKITQGLADIRKAYKKYDTAKAFALYVDGKAVAFAIFDGHDLGGASRTGILAYDFTQFKDEIEKEYNAKVEKETSQWNKDRVRRRQETSSRTEKGYDDKIKQYAGEASTTGELKNFIEELYKLADGKTVSAKIVLHSKESAEKRGKRYHNNMSKGEMLTGLEALRDRLKKYKISKKPTVDTIQDFLKATLDKGLKVIQFGGRGWSTEAKSSDSVNPLNLLKGQSFNVRYGSVEPGEYDSISVTYRYDSETNMVLPFKAEWSGKDESGKKKSEFAVLEKDSYFKNEHGLSKTDKESIIKAILIQVKNGQFYKARKLIADARAQDMDYPEFKTIEKSLDIEEKKKKEQQ